MCVCVGGQLTGDMNGPDPEGPWELFSFIHFTNSYYAPKMPCYNN